MFKALLSNGVMYEFNSFKAIYYRALRELKYVVSMSKSVSSEYGMLFANGEFVCYIYISTYSMCIRSFTATSTKCIVSMRGEYNDN